jgi:hypothetical protein
MSLCATSAGQLETKTRIATRTRCREGPEASRWNGGNPDILRGPRRDVLKALVSPFLPYLWDATTEGITSPPRHLARKNKPCDQNDPNTEPSTMTATRAMTTPTITVITISK